MSCHLALRPSFVGPRCPEPVCYSRTPDTFWGTVAFLVVPPFIDYVQFIDCHRLSAAALQGFVSGQRRWSGTGRHVLQRADTCETMDPQFGALKTISHPSLRTGTGPSSMGSCSDRPLSPLRHNNRDPEPPPSPSPLPLQDHNHTCTHSGAREAPGRSAIDGLSAR